jgi:hypothetical protein
MPSHAVRADGGAANGQPRCLPMAGERYSYGARRKRHQQPVIFPHDVHRARSSAG